ncbi:MAG: DUF995 domain-containing protein [Pseudomonadota bacterium]
MLKNCVKVSLLSSALSAMLLVGGAAADEPDQKILVSGQEVLRIYSGKTWVWSPGEGGAYWGTDGSFQAFWQDSVGVGKWFATSNGNVCYDAKWRSAMGDGSSSERQCWQHVRDSEGVLWKRDPRSRDWYIAEFEPGNSIVPGNTIAAEVGKLRGQTGF